MSVAERELKFNILAANYYYKNQNLEYSFKEKAVAYVKICYEGIIKNLTESIKQIAIECLVELSEVAFMIGEPQTIEIADSLLKIYFEMDLTSGLNKNNFYIRALFVKAQVDAKAVECKHLKAEEAIVGLKQALSSIMKGIELISKPENKVKYASLVYNASIITFNILKNYLKPNWAKNFFENLEKISQLLEESDDVDYNWRLRFLIKLAQSYLDAEKKPEGGKALDKVTELLKKKGECEFQEELYRYRIHLSRENSGALGNLKKEGESSLNNPAFKYIYTVQCIKSGIIQEKDLEKEIFSVVNALYPDYFKVISSVNQGNVDFSIKLDTWKADVLAELAYVLMRFKSQFTQCINLYEFLSKSRSNSLKGKIFLENIRAAMMITKLENELRVNAQPENVVRLKRIEVRTEALKILERNLAGCARILDLDLINETCMQIFNTAIPFLKRTFRKNYFKAFNAASELLEQIQSNESYLRACIHFELAKSFLEDDLLQEADANLIKALTLDYSLPLNKISGIVPSAVPVPGNKQVKITEDPNMINSSSNNVSYLQRNLEQYLIYLKRAVGVKINIYSDPQNSIDQLIFESDNIRNAMNDTVRSDTIAKCVDIIQRFTLSEFRTIPGERELVEEEINDMKVKHDLGTYDDKKHFTLACIEIAKLAYEFNKFSEAIQISEVMTKFQKEWNFIKDSDQIIALAEANLISAKCYEEFLLEEGIEVGASDFVNFNDTNKEYVDTEKDIFKKWRINLLNHIKEATRLAVMVNQYWLVFNCAVQLWNNYFPIIKAPAFVSIVNENVIPAFGDIFEALNSAMIYYESIQADAYDTDFFDKLDLFVNFSAAYAKLLEFKGRPDECIRICDVLLIRKLNSNYRKVFDTIKARALKSGDGKKTAVKPNVNKTKPTKDQTVFIPSQDQALVSDCFQILETANITKEEKQKSEYLRKGIEILKNYKYNFNDESTIELNSELWYKFGVQFFAFNTMPSYKLALYCAENCVKTFHSIDLSYKKEISLTLQKWYCLGFLLYGDTLYKLVDKEKQERLSQIKLYFIAIEKIIKSAKIAEKCSQYYVIHQDVKAFYSIVIQIIDQPQNREALTSKFLELHTILINNRPGGGVLYSDPEFLLLFFSLFCICINESKNWELGERIVVDALKIIPSHLHHFLLENKLFYYSKLGKSFLQNLQSGAGENSSVQAGGDKDVITKAKLFTKLARSSTNKVDQFNAYNRAIDLLKADQNIYVCDVIFELATWLYKNNYPNEDIEDNLNQAADILLEIEPIFDDEEDLEDDGQTLHSKLSGSSRKSRLSKRSKSKQSKSKVTDSRRRASQVTQSRGKASERSRSRNYGSMNIKTKTIFSKLLDYDPYPLYMNIQHMEQLFKIHVFLSIVTNDYQKKQEYLLDAFLLIRKILEMSFKTLNCLDFYDKNKEEIAKLNFNTEVNTILSLVNHFFISRDLNIPQVFSLPDTLDAWVTFQYPDFFINKVIEENKSALNVSATQFQFGSLPNHTFFSKKSFEKPFQFYFYLKYMIDKFMNEYYFHSQCIFLIKFAMLYSKHILENSELEYTFMLKLRRLYHNIIDNTTGTAMNLFKEYDLSIQNNLPQISSEIKAKHREELRKFDLNLNSNNEDCFSFSYVIEQEKEREMNPNRFSVVYVDQLHQHLVWIELASELYAFGYFNFAKEYIDEAIFHCLVLKDKQNFIRANLILAKIYYTEADFENSCKLLNKIQMINYDLEVMFEVVYTTTNMFDYMGKYEEMLVYINNLIVYLSGFENKNQLEKFTGSLSAFYKIYAFALISKIRCNIKKLSTTVKNKATFSLVAQTGEDQIRNSKRRSTTTITVSEQGYSSLQDVIVYFKSNILSDMERLDEIIKKSSNTIYNIHALIDYVDLTLDCLIRNNLFIYVNKNELDVLGEIFESCLKVLFNSQLYLNSIQTFVPARVDNNLIYIPIHRLLGIVKIKYAQINNIIGEFKNRIKRESKKSEKFKIDDDETNEKIKVKYNQEVIDYLNSLTKEIAKMAKIEEKKIKDQNRYEKSISLLSSCESLVPFASREYVMYLIEKIHSHRLQSLHNKELKKIWDSEMLVAVQNMTNENLYKVEKFHQITINLISEFEKNIIGNTIYAGVLIGLNNEMLKYYFNIIESSGYLNIELSFKAVCDYQNVYAKVYLNQVINRYLNTNSRDWVIFAGLNSCKTSFSFSSLYDHIYSSMSFPESINNLFKFACDIPYFKNTNTNFYNSWAEAKSFLPNNSSYFIFQMNADRSILYVGFLYITSTDRKFNYYLKRLIVNSETNIKLDGMIKCIKQMKHILIKSVIVTKEELNKIYDDYNEAIQSFLFTLENDIPLLEPILKDLNAIINPPVEIPEPRGGEKKVQGGKEIPPPGKKKEEKNQGGGDIPLPSSNIESIVFLIDYRFYELPIEHISIFSKIPYKASDFSMNWQIMRLKSISFNPTAGVNTVSITGNVKYYLNYSNQMPAKCDIKKCIDTKLGSTGGKNPTIIEGVVSYDHFPSIPELQKLYSSSNIFFFTSQTCFLYQFPFDIFETSRFSKCKVGFIFDRIANTKNFVDQKSLIPKTFSFVHQPLDTIAMLSMCGLVTIVSTKWSLDYDEISEMIEDMLDESITKGLNIAYSINKYKNPKRVLIPTENKAVVQEETSRKKKDDDKKKQKEEVIVLNETNSVLISKKQIYQYSPMIYGITNVKIV